MPVLLVFAISATAVVLAGIRLSRYGDAIAEKTGLGGAWVGAVLLAGATSLPEFATDYFAIRQDDVDLAVGDLFGSSMANMLILAIADLAMRRRRRVLARVAINQAMVGLIAICLTVVAGAGILAGGELAIFGVGWAPLVAGGSYLAGMRLLHANRRGPLFEQSDQPHDIHERPDAGGSLKPAIAGFAAAAAVILVAAPFLASSAADIAGLLGVSTGVVGVALLALTTSLPELSVTVASMQRGSIDLAVGNLLGSNCFNMAMLLPLDLLDGGGPLLDGVGESALVAAFFATLLTGQTLIEVLNKAERRIWWLEPDAVLRIITYVLGLALVVRVGD